MNDTMVNAVGDPSGRPIDTDRPMKVVCIGAGMSGILTAIRFPQRIQNLDLTIYEKNDDIGGTWYENNYPGIACGMIHHLLSKNCAFGGQG
jgi:cation diffusion facilitator CzcD-associated flavoprotein CzcO